MTSIYQSLREYKYRNFNDPAFEIPIVEENGVFVGTLQCIDIYSLQDPEIIKLLTKWRNQYMQYFLTQFTATEERTSQWLANTVLPAEDRILFLVRDQTGQAIGNFGLCKVGEEYAELDNILRGEKVVCRKLFYYAAIALLSWIFKALNISVAHLFVFSDNNKAISLYERLGFETVNLQGLSRVEAENEISYVTCTDLSNVAGCQYQEMSLEKALFFDKHCWLMSK
jgi:RimJ/RimL family protein N-acetyltransferase